MTLLRGRGVLLLLGALTLLAFVLRVVGLQYGLPAVYNPDEVAIMARALSFAKGTLNPHNFLYPTLYFYLLFAWVAAYLSGVWVMGGVSSLAALQQLYFTDPTGIYTAGRALGAVLGSLCVPATFSLARQIFDTRVAVAAAAFIAVAPLAVRDSHYIKHDVPATLAVILACVAIARVWPSTPAAGRVRNDVIVAGAACGVAFATHYYCVFLVLPLAWAIVQRWRPRRGEELTGPAPATIGWAVVLRHLVTAGIVAAVVFFALSPFLLVEPMIAWRDIVANRQIVVDRAVQSGAFAPLQRYADMLLRDSIGMSVVLLGAAGIGLMLVTQPARAVLLLLFPVAFFAFISNTTPASRYLNPVLPFVALFAAWALLRVADRFRASGTGVAVVIAALCLNPLLESIRVDQFLRTDDTRALAERFIADTIPAGATVLVQPYSVVLTPSREGLIEALTRDGNRLEDASAKFRLQLSVDPYPRPAYRLLYLGRGGLDADKIYVDPAELGSGSALAPLRRRGVTYVVLKRYNTADAEMSELVAELARHGRLLATFSPYRPEIPEVERARIAPFLHNTDTRIDDALERPGPPLEIWQLDGSDS
jgi:hypothetical protein